MSKIFTKTSVTELSMLLRDYIKVGEVTSVNPSAHTARVVFPDDDNAVSYDLPVLCRNSYENHDYNMPDLGEDVLCLFLPGGTEDGFILGSFYAGDVRPPTVLHDQRMVVFQDGTIIRYDRGDAHALDVIIDSTTIHVDRQTINTHAAQTQNHSSTAGAIRHDDQTIEDSAGVSITLTAGSSITLKAPQIILDSPNTTITGNLTQGGGRSRAGLSATLNSTLHVTGQINSDTDVVSQVSLNGHTHTAPHGETTGPH